MNKKIRWITETAVMLALLITLQWMGSLIPEKTTKQLVTGSLVNCVLAVTVLVAGRNSGIAVALISPIFATLFGIADVPTTVPIIMLGNTAYVLLLNLFLSKSMKPVWKMPVALIAASVVKFLILYFIGVKLTAGVLFDSLNGQAVAGTPIMNAGIAKKMTMMFSWVQLATALIGGAVALSITPVLRKARRK